jgi:hypothetical protein
MRKSAAVGSNPSLDRWATSDPRLPGATLTMPHRIGLEALRQQPVHDGGAGWVRGRGGRIIRSFRLGVWLVGVVSEPPSSVLPIPSRVWQAGGSTWGGAVQAQSALAVNVGREMSTGDGGWEDDKEMFYDWRDCVFSSCCSSISASSNDDCHRRSAPPAALVRSCAAPP